VKLLQPVDESDPAWLEALQAGIARRDVQVGALAEEDSPVATETQSIPVFLGARASSAGYTRTAEWLGDEANPADRLDDIIVGARTAASKSKRVLGVLETAVTWGGGYDPARGGLIPRAPMVTEWEGQYEVRTIRPPELAEESSQEIDLLVVPLPSSLNEEGLQGLYEWIWSGRPTLLLVDPFPFDAAQRGEFLAPVEPNAPANPYGGPPPEPKGDIYRFFSGLGLTWDPAAIAWSRSNPAPSLAYLDPHFLWSMRDQGGIGDHPLMTGIDALLTMYPGVLFADLARDPAIRIEPLVTPAKGLAWGVHDYNRMLDRTGYQPRLRSRELPLSPSIEAGPMIAALVQGPLPHAYRSEPSAEGQPQPLVSPDRANLVVIADTDLASGVFLNFYRDVDGSVSESELAVLSTLRNVQFMANIVDYLAGDATMAALRGVRPSHRTLTAIEAVNRDTQNKVDRVAAKAGEEMEAANISADEAFEAQLNAIRNRTDLDQVSKENMVAAISGPAQRRLIDEKADIARTRQRQVDEARREQRATIRSFRQWVQVLAIGIPAVVLALLVALVSAAKLAREQAEVPAARARRN
jgi:ABC-2 type transport system permease protein